MMKTASNRTRLTLPLLAAALALLLLGWLLPVHAILKLIFCVLSFLCSLLELLGPLLADLRAKKWTSSRLLLLVAGILSLAFGAALSAAAALLCYRVGLLLLEARRQRTETLLENRRQLSPLAARLADYEPDPQPSDKTARFVQTWLPYILVLLAAVAAVLTALLSKGGAAAGVRRAAVVLALSGETVLFAAFGLCDYAAVLCAAEHGVGLSPKAAARLLAAKLLLVKPPVSELRGTAAVYPAEPESIGAEAILLMAAHAWADSGDPVADKLAALYGKPLDRAAVTAHEKLPGYGVAAQLRGMAVVSGSAELLSKAGIPIAPFRDGESRIHVGVNGRYAGCIDLEGDAPESALTEAADAAGLFRFQSAEEAADKRLPGETLLYAAGDGQRGPARDTDLFLSLGGRDCGAEAESASGGNRGVCALLSHLANLRLLRKGCFLLIAAVKALALLLAIFGLCPLWLAVALECAAEYYTFVYAVHGLDYEPKY